MAMRKHTFTATIGIMEAMNESAKQTGTPFFEK
jgi:hypothetical protein